MDGGLLVYVVVKGAAYVLWCSVGLAVLDPAAPPSRARALRLGVLRLLLGLGFGVLIWLLGTRVFVTLHEIGGDAASFGVLAVATYLLVYVPVRWIEWGIIELLVVREASPVITFVAGTDPQSRTWRIGGIVLSCLADVPLIVAIGGLPLGRFLC